jgi:hypothetical protein
VSLDESFRLEPTQLTGFSQAFRSVISEAEAGSVAVPEYELGGVALDLKLKRSTYLGIQAQRLLSRADQQIGSFHQNGLQAAYRTAYPEKLEYEEKSISLNLHQLLSDQWAVGAGYRYTRSKLDWSYPTLPASPENPSRTEAADLHHVQLQLFYSHPRGFFGRLESNWFLQDNEGYPNVVHPRSRPSESLCQLNLSIGYRFWRRRGEIAASCLNLTDQDYRLNSLTPYAELPREHVFVGRLRLNF